MKKAMITVSLVALLLTGCAGEVDLSEEDTVRVAQYAADLVLKYDHNYKERLLNPEEQAEAKEKLRLAAERDEALRELLEQKNHATKAEGKKQVESNSKSTIGENEKEAAVRYQLNDVLKLNGFSFQNNGYEVVEEYPEIKDENEDISMELRAATGKKLLIVKYGITNTTDTKAECDLFSKDISAKALVNGSVEVDSMMTMLLNDFSTLKTDIEPGTTYEAVLVFEIPEEEANVQSMELSMTMEGNTYNIQQ